MRAIRMHQTGGPEVLRLEHIELRKPRPGEIVIANRAIGVNYIDTYHRTGLYPIPLPTGLGMEGAGIVEAIGDGVTTFAAGDRVGYCSGPLGAYSEALAVPAARAVTLPPELPFEIAAAALLKGMTARYLLRKTFEVKPGVAIVFHAAAGGVGQIAIQWARQLGATVIAVVGSDEKAAIARALGAAHVINSSTDDIAATVRELTNGEGASVVYDSVGRDTFQASLNSLAPLGLFVSFGNSSGPAPPVDPQALSQHGSLFFTRPTLATYTRTPALLQETANDLFAMIASGAVKIAAPTRYKLEDAAHAHRDLQARRTTGSLVLEP